MSDSAAVFEAADTTAEWLLWWRGLVPERIGSPALSPALLLYLRSLTEDVCSGEPDAPRAYYAGIVGPGPADWARLNRAVGVPFLHLRARIRASVYRWLVQAAAVPACRAGALVGYRTLRRAPTFRGADAPPMAPLPRRWRRHLLWRVAHDEVRHVA